MNFLTEPHTIKWMFFDLNSYFASVEQQDTPELRKRPVAVVPGMSDYTCAIAASYEAKAYGIKTGTKIFEAKEMCPDLVCVLARHDIYVEYHHKILSELERYIPVHKVCSIDEASFKLSPLQQSPEHAKILARDVKAGIKNNIGDCIKCSIGFASNAFLAKVATDMQKPDGLTILEPQTMTDKLFRLDLRDLPGIGQNMERRLIRAGVKSIENLWNISPKHARKIWGSVAGERFWYKLRGYDVPDTQTQKSVVGHSRVLDPVHRNLQSAHKILRRLTSKACARLRRYNLYAQNMSVSISTQNREKFSCDTSFQALNDNTASLKILDRLWHTIFEHAHGETPKKISVTFYGLQKPQDITMDLFEDTKTHVKNNNLSYAIDALNARYGSETINIGQSPKTQAGHVGTKIAFNRIPDREEFFE